MTNVCMFDFPPMLNFHGYKLETFDPWPYFKDRPSRGLLDFFVEGLNGYNLPRAISLGAAAVDRLYRDRDPRYMRLLGDFIDRFRDFDVIVMSTFNFLHPEVLHRELSKPTKVLGFIDDPHSTYLRGIPYLWAFDGAFYISPGYLDEMPFADAIARWTTKPTRWWPLVPTALERPQRTTDTFFRERDVDVIYVGNPTGTKLDRLIQLKRHFRNRIRIHGRWRCRGYFGFARALLGKPLYPGRVTSLSNAQRTQLYWRSKIGFNMHVSEQRYETGNARMFEVPAHGAMLVCDKSAADSHARVFAPNQEAVYYDSLGNAIELIEHYLKYDDERVRIAKNGFDRYWREYAWERNLLLFLNWAASLKRAPQL